MENNRDQWLQVLEKITKTRPDQAEAEWVWVLKELRLQPGDFLPLYEVVRQGRWRRAGNPAGYLKAVARREQRRLTPSGDRRPAGIRGMHGLDLHSEEITLGRNGCVGPDGETLSSEDMLDQMQYRREDSGRAVRDPDGVWRASPRPSGEPSRAAKQAAELETALSRGMATASRRRRRRPRSEFDPSRPALLYRYVKRLERMQAASGKDDRDEPWLEPELLPDWLGWAQAAGLTEWEQKVVDYRLRGITRDQALTEQADETSRKALQAAWKRMQRTGEERLRKNIFSKDVPEDGDNRTG